jgi:hypothetical protein
MVDDRRRWSFVQCQHTVADGLIGERRALPLAQVIQPG